MSRYAMVKPELERRENLWGKVSLANDVCVQAWRAVAWIEFAFGHLGVTSGQASWLVQVGYGVLIGQTRMSLRGKTCKARRLLTCALEERSIADVWGKLVAGKPDTKPLTETALDLIVATMLYKILVQRTKTGAICGLKRLDTTYFCLKRLWRAWVL